MWVLLLIKNFPSQYMTITLKGINHYDKQFKITKLTALNIRLKGILLKNMIF